MHKNITSKEFRNKRENFRQSNGHKHLPEVSLVASKESTAMFNVAGMQQLIPYLAGKKHPTGDRLFNIQKCIRTNDIDEVGDSSHLTFFEMMGNRSLGDYFKKEAVQYSYDFLVNELGFDPKKLAVTVFEGNKDAPKDEETAKYREEVGLSKDKISYLSENRRTPGPVGPCGPDTEIFYRVGEGMPTTEDNVKKMEDENKINPNNKENRLEIRNNVFMEYYRDEDGTLTKLKNQNVDTGMGFERMTAILQNKETIFETDLFQPMIKVLEEETKKKYIDNKKSFRIIADHFRASATLIDQGVFPSNIGAGYVLRKLIRRMYYKMFLDSKNYEFSRTQIIRKLYKELGTEENGTMIKEMDIFSKTIHNGKKKLNNIIQVSSENIIKGKDAFFLYDTCGFPLALTKEIAKEKGFQVDEKGFNIELETQKERSRKSAKFQKDIDRSKYLEGIPQTEFIGYSLSHCEDTKQSIKLLKDFDANGQRVLIFDKTPFYAESGGQKGDSGNIELDLPAGRQGSGEILKIKDVQKYEGVFLHLVDLKK